jgi:hypothetical protein
LAIGDVTSALLLVRHTLSKPQQSSLGVVAGQQALQLQAAVRVIVTLAEQATSWLASGVNAMN